MSYVAAVPTWGLAYEPPQRLVFGGDAAYPPFEWLERDRPRGFNIDLARAISGIGETDVEHTLGPWPEMVRALEAGSVDVVPMFISHERQEKFLFTMPFHYIDHAIYARGDVVAVYAVSDLVQQRVAVEERSFAERQLVVENIGAVPVLTANTVDALLAVEERRADYAILAAPIADRLIHTHGLSLKRLGPPFWPRGYAFAVRKDRVELKNWLQQTMALAISTGVYQEVYDQWQAELKHVRPDNTRFTRAIIIILFSLALLAAITVTWSWMLRRKVRDRTEDLQSALKQVQTAESHARHLANFDAEIGLAKPHYFTSLVNELLKVQTNQPAPDKEVLIIQLVGLDDVVGTFGKTYSEAWIQQFAVKLRTLCQGPCAYFGRAVFGVCTDKEMVKALLDALLMQQDPEVSYFRFVGGAAYYPEHGTTSTELIRCAEMALAIGLANHEQRVVYDPSMEPDPFNMEVISRFREDNVEGLYSVFQPQVDLKTGAITGAEALARWKHPALGLIGPDKFIPLIEKAGLISKVTVMMIDEAVRLSSHLRGLGQPLVISVNIAVYDLVVTDLPRVVTEALERYKGRAADLKLELTETSFASDCGQTRGVLDQLNQLGVCISIDDFGTGYSSLSYLSVFPIQELKIDRTFVFDMVRNERNCGIVRSTILLASQLGLQSVAEGAEDEATVQMLKNYGCDRVQGYVISKPLPESEFMDFLRCYS